NRLTSFLRISSFSPSKRLALTLSLALEDEAGDRSIWPEFAPKILLTLFSRPNFCLASCKKIAPFGLILFFLTASNTFLGKFFRSASWADAGALPANLPPRPSSNCPGASIPFLQLQQRQPQASHEQAQYLFLPPPLHFDKRR